MNFKSLLSRMGNVGRLGAAFLALLQVVVGAPMANAQSADERTATPIKHVIIIIGENRSFDHVFATYEPKRGERVDNLLSRGIITLDDKKNAIPGRHFEEAHQLAAVNLGGKDPFLLSPPTQKFPNDQLPAPLVGGPKDSVIPNQCIVKSAVEKPITECTESLALAKQAENGLPESYLPALLTGGTGLSEKVPDTRISNVTALPAGPFQLTNGSTLTYDDYAASPVHRFYQMYQQLNCSAEHARPDNPSGCDGKLFSWVEVTVGAGSNGVAQPPLCSSEAAVQPCFTTNYLPALPKAQTTGEGSTALGFYNVQQGDAPYFKELADNYAMSDNFHQSVHGGTGANHIMFGHGDAIWFTDGKGRPAIPPENVRIGGSNANQAKVNQIENPNPASGTNNWYVQDGYGDGGFDKGAFGGGSYSNCADASQPGVKEVVKYLSSLPRPVPPRCEPGHYYLLNNYNPGYFGDGSNAFLDTSAANTPFTVPPVSTASIGDDMSEHKISWKYYGDHWNAYLTDKYQKNYKVAPGVVTDEYCNICNPFQFDTSIMTNKAQRDAHLQDTLNLYADIASNSLPAVSFVKPSGLVDGHPASSKLNLFEGFCKKIVDQVQASPYAKDTAIFITFDEGGGYYDSGYVQPVDFFGDGTRIPLIVVAPYTKAGHISHEYTDHVSLLKFIERNWNLPPVTKRSRDNFPNPKVDAQNPYVPVNSPAIGDLFDLFDFPSK